MILYEISYLSFFLDDRCPFFVCLRSSTARADDIFYPYSIRHVQKNKKEETDIQKRKRTAYPKCLRVLLRM